MTTTTEPRNPLYFLLLVVGVIFCMTAFAYAVVPILEEKARSVGEIPPPSPLRESFNKNGWIWLLGEVAALIVVGLASMAVDHFRRIRKEASSVPQSSNQDPAAMLRPDFSPTAPSPGVSLPPQGGSTVI